MNNVMYPFLSKDKVEILSIIKSAEKNELIDIDGNTYLDCMSGLWNMPLGYSELRIKKAIESQLNSVPFVNLESNSTIIQEKLAEKIINLTHDKMRNIIYGATGSEIVDMSIKLARQYQFSKNRFKRKFIVSFDISYHGTTYGAISLSGSEQDGLYAIDPLLGGVFLLKTYRNGMDIERYKDYLINFIRKNEEKIAGVILEPVFGVGGIIKVPDEIIGVLSEICIEKDILIIVDEITTAFYRTGKYFGYQLFDDFFPDVILLSKALTNGYLPLSLAVISEKITESYGEVGVLPHVTTQGGNPISCAAALETLNILDDINIDDLKYIQNEVFKQLKLLESKINVKEVRNIGMMFAIELENDRKQASFDFLWDLYKSIKEDGLLLYPYMTSISTGLILMPAYTFQKRDIDKVSTILQRNM